MFVVGFLFVVNIANAHSPDLSSFMIYEQNGKFLLLIKSSLTAFEGEIDYHYGKNAYKTPEEFIQLVVEHFRKNSLLIINNDTIGFQNLQVQIGHETTLFAELAIEPENFKSFFIRNTMFNDMPNNQTELILTTKGLPQKQYILYNGNDHQIALRVEDGKWEIGNTSTPSLSNSNFILWGALFLITFIAGLVIKYRTPKIETLNETI